MVLVVLPTLAQTFFFSFRCYLILVLYIVIFQEKNLKVAPASQPLYFVKIFLPK